METQGYVKLLEREFADRQRNNESYSLRAYARDLKIDPSTLSAILKGKRTLPLKRAQDVAKCLNLCPSESQFFYQSLASNRSSLRKLLDFPAFDTSLLLTEDHYYKVMAEWEHYATLSLLQINKGQWSYEKIGKRLGISTVRAKDIIDRLIDLELVQRNAQGELHPTHSRLDTTDGIKSTALRKAQKEALQMGIDKLDQVPMKERSYSIETIPVDIGKIDEAREMILEDRKSVV